MAAARSCTNPCWSDLPTDLLASIVQLLELPGALAFASVCTSWRAAAGDIPHPRTPWLMSWDPDSHPAGGRSCSAVTCKLRNLLDVDRVHSLTFPAGTFVTCCGASNGWLVVVDELCNLSLHNPFTSITIPLPPVTDFPCVTAVVHDDQGKIKGYRLSRSSGQYIDAQQYAAYHLATYFYWKAELSGDPSGGGDYAVTIVHFGGRWISHVRAGDTRWRVLVANRHIWGHGHPDAYADCAYHKGSVYAVTYQGIVERWPLDDAGAGTPSEKQEEVVQDRRLRDAVLARHLVVSPGGGGLWMVSAVWEPGRAEYPDAVRFTFRVVDVDDDAEGEGERESVQAHALFLGMNRPAWLPTGTGSFPGVRPGVLYFSAPWMRRYSPALLERVGDWGGARAYDVLGKTKARTFERVFPGLLPESARLMDCPTEVWVTPNLY
ncbi:hypothetical protein CFC21_018678 [Triticum aestivum]|uniref:F-box domain-containing protein n=2 Tax=Triticum aestivum TaxID=4565 RepID=A0A9R1E413_WHEAT|nr:hypothetical protein CFC21_018678 [Triticum aestivum]